MDDQRLMRSTGHVNSYENDIIADCLDTDELVQTNVQSRNTVVNK